MKNTLNIKRILRVALVDKGDNPEAEIVIHKRAKMQKAISFADAMTQTSMMDDYFAMADQLASCLMGIMYDDAVEDKRVACKESIQQFADALKGKLTMQQTEKAEKVGLIKQIMKAVGLADADVTIPPAAEPNKETPVDDQIAKAEAEALQKKADELEKRALRAEADLAKAQEAGEAAEFSKRAEALTGVPGITADFGVVLRKISKAVTPDELAALEASLKGAAEIIRESKHFEEVGKNTQTPTSAEAKLDAAAAEAMKADAKLTKEAAMTKIMKERPALYTEYRQEQAGKEHVTR